jgi:tetratricopeptide (TPR) repeat protein
MKKLPFDIPDSLKSYVITYQESPAKGIANLENYLSKRRIDAVGYFLLAVLYQSAGRANEAIMAASRARTLAPGSKTMEHLHYFLTHPDGFEAWVPDTNPIPKVESKSRKQERSNISIDLETLISKLTNSTTTRIKFNEDDQGDETSFLTDGGEAEELATPTLAIIYEKQGKIDEAIKVYQNLAKARPGEAKKYMSHIERLLSEE